MLFHHKLPVSPITDIQSAMRENDDVIGGADVCPCQGRPAKLPQTHFGTLFDNPEKQNRR